MPDQWIPRPGLAHDIGVGADGSVWVIGTNPVYSGGTGQHPITEFGIHKWTESTWEPVDGAGRRIAVDQNGNPWVVNSRKQIYRRVNNQWETQLPGLAYDIGTGADGSVWVIGDDHVGTAHDFGVHKWTGSAWERLPDGGGVRIAVDENGNPWVVNSAGQIYRRVNNQWEKLPDVPHFPWEHAYDIGIGGIGADGSVWVTAGYRSYRWTGSTWEAIDGAAAQISVDVHGLPWVVDGGGQISQRVRQ